MGSPLRELLAYFDINVDASQLESGSKKIEGFVGKLKLVGTAVAEALAVHEIKEFVSHQIEAAAHVQDLAERLDISATSIQAFAFAAKSAGLDVDTAAHALQVLQRNMGMATGGKGAAQAAAFAQLGVKLKDASGQARPFNEVLLDLSDGMKKLPDHSARAAAATHTMGRQGALMLPILEKGRGALEAMFKEQQELSGGLGNDFYGNAKKAREEGEHFEHALNSITNVALANLLPMLTGFLTLLNGTAKGAIDVANRTNILQTVMMTVAMAGGLKLLGTLRSLATTFGILQPTVMGTARAFAGFAFPLVAIALLYLVFDELYTLMTGGKTIIGDTVDEFFGLGSAAQAGLFLNAVMKDTLHTVTDIGKVLFDTVLLAITSAIASLGALGAGLHAVLQARFGDIGGDMKTAFKADYGLGTAQGHAGDIIDATKRLGGGTDTKNLEDLHTMLAAGIDPRMLQAGQLGHATAGSAAATKQGIVAQNTGNRWYVPVPGVHGKGGRGNVHVDQRITQHITSKHDNPKAIGDAAGMGTATAAEKALNAALASQVSP